MRYLIDGTKASFSNLVRNIKVICCCFYLTKVNKPVCRSKSFGSANRSKQKMRDLLS